MKLSTPATDFHGTCSAKSDKVHAAENAQGPKNWFDIRKWSLQQPANESVHPYGPLSLVVLWDTNGGREAPK